MSFAGPAAQRQAIAKRKAAAKAKRVAAAKAKRAAAAKRWVSPIENPSLTSSFGPRWGRLHAGLDFGAVLGPPLHALSTGTVTKAGWVLAGVGVLPRPRRPRSS